MATLPTLHLRPLLVAGVGASLLLTACGTAEPVMTASVSPSPTETAVVIDAAIPLEDQLLEAVTSGDLHYIEALIAAGVDVNAEYENTNTALSLAITRDDAAMVRALLDAGAIHTDADLGVSMLSFSAQFAGPEVALALIEAGADPNGEGDAVGGPLTNAAYRNNLAFAQLLVDYGANVDQGIGEENFFPLQSAAYLGHTDMVAYLLSVGADPEQTTTDGRNSLEWAVNFNRNDCADLLRSVTAS